MEILFEFAETGEIQVTELNDELEAYKNIIDDIEIKLILGKPKMIYAMSRYTQGLEEQRVRIGLKCFLGCTKDGLKKKSLNLR